MTVEPGIVPDQVGRRPIDAVIVTFEPDLDHLAASLDRVLSQVGRLLVVDNGSENISRLESLLATASHAELMSLGSNLGIAAALNVGLDWAMAAPQVPDWLLTLDQDTMLHEHAVERLLGAFEALDGGAFAEACALLAMRFRPIVPPRRLWAWVEGDVLLGNVGAFQERRMVITSGSLLRVGRLAGVRFDERLFIDQVDSAFCADLRRRGLRIVEYGDVTMAHQVGSSVVVRGRSRGYENGQRLYYIVRNSALLLCRGDLPVSVYVVQLLEWFRTYLLANGIRALPRALAILGCGLGDAALGRLGRRDYPFLRDPSSWSRRRSVGEQRGGSARV